MAFFRERRHKPKLTFILIAVCTAIFFAELAFPAIENYFSFVPTLAFREPWRFVTSIFLHAGLDHLFFNMFALFIFGIYLESSIGVKRFLLIFFVAGILGNVAYMVLSPASSIPAVGASGAIYGVMGMLAVMQPTLIVYVGYIPMPMILAAVLWTATEFLGLFVPSDIAHEAHLAGIIVGAIYGWIMRKRKAHYQYF
jgi:membrane associated rhomboid family serine protease